MKIQNNHVVSIHYTLKNDAGEVIDSSAGRAPLDYIQGKGMIVPGLEKAMIGKGLGDKFSVTVSPEEGYGTRRPELVQEIPLNVFQGVDTVEPGMTFVANGPNGRMMVTISEVRDTVAVVDGNHELADKNLNFEIEVATVREATADELEEGLSRGGCCGGGGGCGCHDESDEEGCCGGGDGEGCCGGSEDGEEKSGCCGGTKHGQEHECCGGHDHGEHKG
jgi:FKBP-type peptidyl-prolyl cis-trans isomerase SlyD